RAVSVCRRPALRRAIGRRPASDRASRRGGDRRLARPDRLYRPLRRNGPRRRHPRPSGGRRDRTAGHHSPLSIREKGTIMAEQHTVALYTDYKSPYAYLAKDL